MFVIRRFSVAHFDAASNRFRLCGGCFSQTPFMPVVRMELEPVGNNFYAKRGAGFSTSWGLKLWIFWHHTLSYFPFVDLSVELASDWHGVEVTINLVPVEDFKKYPITRYFLVVSTHIDASLRVDLRWIRNIQESADSAAIGENIAVGTGWTLIYFLILCLHTIDPNPNPPSHKGRSRSVHG